MSLNTLEQARLSRMLEQMRERIAKLERYFSGTPITSAHIESLEWDKAQGGTATLGGAANGDGILTIKNASGDIINQLDKDGAHYYDLAGDELVTLSDLGLQIFGANEQNLSFLDVPGGTTIGTLSYQFGGNTGLNMIGFEDVYILAMNTGHTILLRSDGNLALRSNDTVVISADPGPAEISVAGTGIIDVTCTTFNINGAPKTAVVKTSKGYNALYCAEAPQVWFFDFAKVIRAPWWKFWEKDTYAIDKTFLETVEGVSVVMPTLDKNYVQIWGIRKGFKDIRFESKTKEEFEKNNHFWSQAKYKTTNVKKPVKK